MKNFAQAFRRELAHDAFIYALIFLYMGMGVLWVYTHGQLSNAPYEIYMQKKLLLYFAVFPVCSIVIYAALAIAKAPHQPLTYMVSGMTARRLARYAAGLVLMMAFIYFQGTFALVKTSLSAGPGFIYDTYLADLDKWLHFGIDPWRLTHAFFNSLTLKFIVEYIYVAVWVFYVFGVLFYMCVSPRAERVRLRYLACYILNWVLLGNLIAAFTMSAGPCYFGFVTGDGLRFAELVNFMQLNVDTSPIAISQNYLWQLHENGRAAFGTGISAFPSLHIAAVALNAYFAREISPKLAILAWMFVVVIEVCSVYTGWHYAIDGYAAIALTGVLYYGLLWLWPHLSKMMQDQRNLKPLTAE